MNNKSNNLIPINIDEGQRERLKSNFQLTILSEDKKELVSIITCILNRKGIELVSIDSTRMIPLNQFLVILKVIAEPKELNTLALKIKNIIEVLDVKICLTKGIAYQKESII